MQTAKIFTLLFFFVSSVCGSRKKMIDLTPKGPMEEAIVSYLAKNISKMLSFHFSNNNFFFKVTILKNCFPHFRNIMNMVHNNESQSNNIFEALKNSELTTISVDIDGHRKKRIKIYEEVDAAIITAKNITTDKFSELIDYGNFNIFTKAILFLINQRKFNCDWAKRNLYETQFLQFKRVYFFCIDSTKKVRIYTYTRGVDWAPPTWTSKLYTARRAVGNQKKMFLHSFYRLFLEGNNNLRSDFLSLDIIFEHRLNMSNSY